MYKNYIDIIDFSKILDSILSLRFILSILISRAFIFFIWKTPFHFLFVPAKGFAVIFLTIDDIDFDVHSSLVSCLYPYSFQSEV